MCGSQRDQQYGYRKRSVTRLLYITHTVQPIEVNDQLTKEALEGDGDFRIRGKSFADDLVLLEKKKHCKRCWTG